MVIISEDSVLDQYRHSLTQYGYVLQKVVCHLASGLLQQLTDMKAIVLLTAQAFCPRGLFKATNLSFCLGLL